MTDINRLQYHYETFGYATKLTVYRRVRAFYLFIDGKAQRPMSVADWNRLQADWPKEVEQDKLTLRAVWTLVEVDHKAPSCPITTA